MSDAPILIGLDGSPGSLRALDFGLSMAKAQQCPVMLMCVIHYSAVSFPVVEDLATYEALRAREVERIKKDVLGPALERCEKAGLKADSRIEFGLPNELLSETAEEIKAQAIVIGRRGLSRIRALVFGSVASSLVQVAPVPVIVVP